MYFAAIGEKSEDKPKIQINLTGNLPREETEKN